MTTGGQSGNLSYMNRKSLIPAVMAGLLGLSACTPQQIADAVAVASQAESETTAPSAASAMRVEVDCTHLAITITEPAGSNVFVSIGSEPPYGFTVGAEPTWGFVDVDGAYTRNIEIEGYFSVHSFPWAVDVDNAPGAGSVSHRVAEGFVACPA